MLIPSFSALVGSKHLLTSKPKTGDRLLKDLNQGTARMIDTYIYNYPKLVRHPEPFAKVNAQGANTKIAIIGSGFTGATASYELKRAFGHYLTNANITLYEARTQDNINTKDRNEQAEVLLGGRAYSRYFYDQAGNQYCNEMGAMRVPENSKLFWHYLAKIIDDPEAVQKIFPNPGIVPTQLIYRGIRYTWDGALGNGNYPKPDNPLQENTVNWEKLINDLFGENGFVSSFKFKNDSLKDIAQLLKKEALSVNEKQRIQAYWHYFLEKYEDKSFVEVLNHYFNQSDSDHYWGETEFNMFATLGFGTGGFGPIFPICFLELLRLLLWQYDQEYSPSLSMQTIVHRLINLDINPEKQNKANIQIRPYTVSYIGQSKKEKRPCVYFIDPKKENKICSEIYDYVIVATPLRSMQISMNLDASFPPHEAYQNTDAIFKGKENNLLREAIRIPHTMNASKLFGLLETKPWLDNKAWPSVNNKPIKCVLTDTLVHQMYFLDPYPNNDQAGSNVLISYNWGDGAIKTMAIQNYQTGQTINPQANSDYHLKTAYQAGLTGAIEASPIADCLTNISLKENDKQSENLQSVVWQEESMIFGGFELNYPRQYHYRTKLVYQYQSAQQDQRVFLAGNNVSYQGGWIEGAMQSAVNATSAVLKHMQQQGKIEVDSFRMDELFIENPFSKFYQTFK